MIKRLRRALKKQKCPTSVWFQGFWLRCIPLKSIKNLTVCIFGASEPSDKSGIKILFSHPLQTIWQAISLARTVTSFSILRTRNCVENDRVKINQLRFSRHCQYSWPVEKVLQAQVQKVRLVLRKHIPSYKKGREWGKKGDMSLSSCTLYKTIVLEKK